MNHHKISYLFLVCCICLFGHQASAQDELLDLLNEETKDSAAVNYTIATFKATRIINGQSVEMTSPGVLSFIIGHRFGKINDGFYQLFGLDQATIRFGFEFGLSDRLNLGLGRSSFFKTYDFYAKYKLLKQSTGARNTPVTATAYYSTSINGLENAPGSGTFNSRLAHTYQLLVARKFSDKFSFQLSPTFVHRNQVRTREIENDIVALGAGARFKLSQRTSINAEYFYQFPSTNADITNNSLSIGFDIETGGHVFQVHITNAQGMVERYFVTETAGNLFDGDIYFGFNVNRVFTIGKGKRDKKRH